MAFEGRGMRGEDRHGGTGRGEGRPVVEAAQRLLLAAASGQAPWHGDWTALSRRALSAMNPTTLAPYKGANRLLLALEGRPRQEWMTTRQAQSRGWTPRDGERPTVALMLVDVPAAAAGSAQAGRAQALRAYGVFNGEQLEGCAALAATSHRADGLARLALLVEAAGGEDAAAQARATCGLGMAFGEAPMVVDGDPRCASIAARDPRGAVERAAALAMSRGRQRRMEAWRKRWGAGAAAIEDASLSICAAFLAADLCIDAPAEVGARHRAIVDAQVRALSSAPLAVVTAARHAQDAASWLHGAGTLARMAQIDREHALEGAADCGPAMGPPARAMSSA